MSVEPEDEIVRAELDEASKKRSTGRSRIIVIFASVLVVVGVFAFSLTLIED